jgi:hypothetical protein
MYSFRCALCNTSSVKWLLHEQAGITPETPDNWDNLDVTDPETSAGHPDMHDKESVYWKNENNMILLSNHWVETMGRVPRVTATEMARVRRARRLRNKARRDRVAEYGLGIGGLCNELP